MAKAKSGAVGATAVASPLTPLAPGESPSPAREEGPGRELVLGEYRGQGQQRDARPSDWSQAMRDTFIEALADSCNVSLAARAIDRSISNVYKQRTTNADFRGAWDQALAIGYARLEMMMLERALHGVEKIVVLKSGESKVMREYPDRIALALLRLHRDNVSATNEGVDDEDYQEACARIIERLERLRERDAEEDAERALETKQAVDRLALMLWGLRRRGRTVDARAR
jgi:hypothetical protein